MTTLPLAVGIADTILKAAQDADRFNLTEKAQELILRYPAADVTSDDVVSTLREEGRSAGICLDPA